MDSSPTPAQGEGMEASVDGKSRRNEGSLHHVSLEHPILQLPIGNHKGAGAKIHLRSDRAKGKASQGSG